jgi:mannitol/fructose-specific phosphotransferase system IIA component (Ntr-type)
MLEKYLTEDVIQLNLDVENWEAAVRAGGALLLKSGKCEPAYIDAMVRTVQEMGAYMVLAPGLALAHARPEDGVLDVGLSLVTLKNPVEFGSKANDPVKLVISFCAIDHEAHVDVLKALAQFLRVESNQQLLKHASAPSDVIAAFESELLN